MSQQTHCKPICRAYNEHSFHHHINIIVVVIKNLAVGGLCP